MIFMTLAGHPCDDLSRATSGSLGCYSVDRSDLKRCVLEN